VWAKDEEERREKVSDGSRKGSEEDTARNELSEREPVAEAHPGVHRVITDQWMFEEGRTMKQTRTDLFPARNVAWRDQKLESSSVEEGRGLSHRSGLRCRMTRFNQ